MTDLKILNEQMDTLVIFRSLLEHPVIISLKKLIVNIGVTHKAISSYSGFVYELYKENTCFSEFLYNYILQDENFYIKAFLNHSKSPELEACLSNELNILQWLSCLSSDEVKSFMDYKGFLPDWTVKHYDFASAYRSRLENLSTQGYGIYSTSHAFVFKNNSILPVKHPDSLMLKSLTGYERERKLVIDNTLALLDGKPACNVLLYGDAGTGKSSTVKAVVNEFKERGLRLIEVKKHQLYDIPDLMDKLSENPLKFIIFIDDLSFSENDDSFSSLKSMLEGGVSCQGGNTLIYATSNRRHLTKENLNKRTGDDLHINDTLQETMSLSSRFGITITFQRPDRDTYLDIVRSLAKEYNLTLPDHELTAKAEAFAIRCSGRSPRTARQFIELQASCL